MTAPRNGPASPALLVVLSREQLVELAALVAQMLMEGPADGLCDQDNLPPTVTRRTYLDAARRGEFATRRVGRRLVVKREDLERWIASRPAGGSKPKKKPAGPAVDPELAAIIANNRAKLS